jgi:hypothetical protein
MHVQMYTVEMLIIYRIKIHILLSGPLLNTEGHFIVSPKIKHEEEMVAHIMYNLCSVCVTINVISFGCIRILVLAYYIVCIL